MIKIVITYFFIFISLSCAQTYKYKKSTIDSFRQGCVDSGANESFCNCQVIVLINNVPENEFAELNKSLYNLYINPNTIVPQNHIDWLQEMYKCQGK